MKIVPDTSVIVDGRISYLVQDEDFEDSEIIIPEAVISELEYQANKGRESGFNGLEELKNLQKYYNRGIIHLSFVGERPNIEEITLSRRGEIDAMIRDIARKNDAMLITSDKVQSEVAKAQGLDVVLIKPNKTDFDVELEISKYFTEDTLSVHLKEGVVPMAKKGNPGNIILDSISNEKLTHRKIKSLAKEITEKAKSDFKSFIEIEMDGATVVQFREYRISIARPPFADTLEITAVRPVANVSLDDYELSDVLLNRLRDTAKGILISGPPGAGKSTFAQAVADFYSKDLNAIVKTMESPRDLQVGDEITQYAPLEGDMQNTADILLLVRPDYTIYDEVRKTKDFKIFSDMRLAGVGMIGVVHATRPIDAIQRIIGRVELGVIPSIVDTTIFINNGKIEAVYDVNLTVKVPSGMVEADLARPLIEIRNFETKQVVYEIYTYGEQTVVMDVANTQLTTKNEEESSVRKITAKEIERVFTKEVPNAYFEVDVFSDDRATVKIEEKHIPQIIGKQGKNINKLEKKIGIHLNIEPLDENNISNNFEENMDVSIELTKKFVVFNFGKDKIGIAFDIFVRNDYLFTATVGKKGTIRIKRNMELANIILNAMKRDIPIMYYIRDDN